MSSRDWSEDPARKAAARCVTPGDGRARLRQEDQAGAALRRSALSPSAPARHPQGLLCPLHVAAGIWDPLRPVEPVLEARSDAVAGNPVTSSPFGPEGSGCVPGAALPGQTEPLSPPWMLSNLGKAHTGWEERHREVKPLARGHPERRSTVRALSPLPRAQAPRCSGRDPNLPAPRHPLCQHPRAIGHPQPSTNLKPLLAAVRTGFEVTSV